MKCRKLESIEVKGVHLYEMGLDQLCWYIGQDIHEWTK